MPRQLTEDEIYQRHQQRKIDREKLKLLKLDLEKNADNPEYLELVNKYPVNTSEHILYNMPKRLEQPVVDEVLTQYQQIREEDKSNNVILELVPIPKKKKKKRRKVIKKKKVVVKDDEIEEVEEFQPKMAGKTGLPSFFFHKIVESSKNIFQTEDRKNSRSYKTIAQEKLRTKILTRLSKEGSSADEPLNIPLSDYSSDEGNSSSSSDDEGKDSLIELEGPCCQPFRVPPPSPIIISNKKSLNGKKIKKHIKLSSPKKRNKLTRSVMDIPTTDPGSDFLDFTTEDECETEYDYDGNTVFTTKSSIPRIPKIRTENTIRKSSSMSGDQHLMPPELIITKVSDDNQLNFTEKENKILDFKQTQFTQNIIKEFPPIGGKKNKSWHNYNRCMSTMKIRNINCDTTYQTAESLHFKLSLKKQIWTGTQSDNTLLDFSRPLSWGAHVSSSALLSKSMFYDSEALLTACSQKLSAWQENEALMNGTSAGEKIKLESLGRGQKMYPKKPTKEDKKLKTDQRSESISDGNSNFLKVKKRSTRNTLNKVVETADIVSHLVKNTKSSSAKIKKSVHYSSTSNNGVGNPATLNSINTPKSIKSFKAGGIVATAVQNKKFLKKSTQPLLTQNSPTKSTQFVSDMILNSPNTDSEPENLKISTVQLKSKHKHRSHKLHKGNSKENSKKSTKSSP